MVIITNYLIRITLKLVNEIEGKRGIWSIDYPTIFLLGPLYNLSLKNKILLIYNLTLKCKY